AVSQAIAKLRQAGIDEPYALVLTPKLYAELASLMQHGRREMAMVESVVEAGLFQYPKMPAEKALLVGASAWNADIVLGQDIATAHLGNEGLDHRFRIFETLALRIKRPEAICVLA
ncbi:MAG: family 1 encapsulin nanocompartment shell protein, partial [Anaerolineae bacterium]